MHMFNVSTLCTEMGPITFESNHYHYHYIGDGVMVMCNGNALQCITIFKVMGSNV